MITKPNSPYIVIYIVNRTSTTEKSNSEALSRIKADQTLELKNLCSISYQDLFYDIAISSDGN